METYKLTWGRNGRDSASVDESDLLALGRAVAAMDMEQTIKAAERAAWGIIALYTARPRRFVPLRTFTDRRLSEDELEALEEQATDLKGLPEHVYKAITRIAAGSIKDPNRHATFSRPAPVARPTAPRRGGPAPRVPGVPDFLLHRRPNVGQVKHAGGRRNNIARFLASTRTPTEEHEEEFEALEDEREQEFDARVNERVEALEDEREQEFDARVNKRVAEELERRKPADLTGAGDGPKPGGGEEGAGTPPPVDPEGETQ